MEKLILGTRRSGKTQNLIERCSRDRYSIIVCPTREMCKITFDMAQDMGKPIPLPITFKDFCYQKYFGRFIDKFYFDELQMSIDNLAQHVPIEAAVFDTTHIRVEDIRQPITTNYYINKKYQRVQVDYDAFDTARVTRNILEELLEANGFRRE